MNTIKNPTTPHTAGQFDHEYDAECQVRAKAMAAYAAAPRRFPRPEDDDGE